MDKRRNQGPARSELWRRPSNVVRSKGGENRHEREKDGTADTDEQLSRVHVPRLLARTARPSPAIIGSARPPRLPARPRHDRGSAPAAVVGARSPRHGYQRGHEDIVTQPLVQVRLSSHVVPPTI